MADRIRRRPGPVLIVGTVGLAAAVAVTVLALTGALSADPVIDFDPGPVVRLGLPPVLAARDLLASVTVGLLVLGTWAVAPDPGTDRLELTGLRLWMVRAAAAFGLGWGASSVAGLALTAADVSLTPPGSPGFTRMVVSFSSQLEIGRAWAASIGLVLAVVVLAGAARRVTTAAWAAGCSVLALVPLAFAGHSAGSSEHANAVDSLAIHLVGATLWVGGLAALLLTAGRLSGQLPAVVGRYSTMAAVSFVLVAGSGLINAALRLDGLSQLRSTYGLLILGKVAALLALGLFGWVHRRANIPRLSVQPRRFRRLAAVELAVMGATFGLAVALSRSAPPATDPTSEDPVAALLGYPMPPPLSLTTFFTAFHPSVVWLSVAGSLAGLYSAGVVTLRRRGDSWPWSRLVFWGLGCVVLIFVTSGGPAVYGRVMFSVHMVAHMSLMVLVPLLFVLAAPLTLALRAFRPRGDASLGPRETLLLLIHSRPLRLLGHPVVAAVLFIASLVVFYYSGLFRLAMFTHAGHVLMTAHFLLVGYLFIWSLVGVDPGPYRPSYPFRLLLLLGMLAFHSFFGVSLMMSDLIIAPDWWAALGLNDRAALLADQQSGGAVAWAAGDLPALLLGIALVVGWVRSDAQRARRLDRQADRDGEAELRRYNEQLAALARRDQRS